MSVRAANIARKNATFAPLAGSLWTGPGGASKKPACAGPGGPACRELSSSIFSRRVLLSQPRQLGSHNRGNLSYAHTIRNPQPVFVLLAGSPAVVAAGQGAPSCVYAG